MFGIGWLLQRVVLNRVLGPDILPPLLVTFGLSIVLQNALLETWSADSRRLSVGALETASLSLGPITVGVLPVMTFVTAIIVIVALNQISFKTELGRAFRATSEIPSLRAYGHTSEFDFCHCHGACHGDRRDRRACLGIRANFDPSIGPARLIYAFEVIIGGLGSLWGTLLSGINWR